MKTFTLTLTSCSKTLFSGLVDYCGVTTMEGEIGFEAFHEPFIGVLEDNSSIFYRVSSGEESTAEVDSGIVTFEQNKCTVAADFSPDK